MRYFIVIKEIGFFLKEKIDKMNEGRKLRSLLSVTKIYENQKQKLNNNNNTSGQWKWWSVYLV